MGSRFVNVDRNTQMMLALLLYCYANGVMSSRKIETATWKMVPMRYLTGNPSGSRYDQQLSQGQWSLGQGGVSPTAAHGSADERDEDDGQRLPAEINRREVLREKIREAKAAIEEQARQDREEHDRDDDEQPPKGTKQRVDPQQAKPEDKPQIKLIDPESALIRKSNRDAWQQAYNAQAVVDADGSGR